jgi:Na+/H+ antiporter NhaC
MQPERACYTHHAMKKFLRPLLILIISLLLLFLMVAFNSSRPNQRDSIQRLTGGALAAQITSTPEAQPEEDQSVVGSTDGITLMSFVIAAIILIPIVMKRKNWDANS